MKQVQNPSTKRAPGSIRVAINSYKWHDFNLKPGAAFGFDFDGSFVASFGTSSARFGIADPKPRHIIVFRAVNQFTAMPIVKRKTVWGANSRAIGRRPIIAPAGTYSSPWAYVWQWEQVHVDDPLAQKMLAIIHAYHEGIKRKAAKEAMKARLSK